MTSPKNPNLRPDEAGFILPLVLIIVAIGAMVVIGLVGYATGLFRAGGQDTDALRELYAADAGVAHVKKLLQQPEEKDQCDKQLKIEVNSLEVNIRVICERTPGTAVPTPQPVPIDPVLTPVLRDPHSVTLNSVPAGTTASVFWVFTPPSPTPTPIGGVSSPTPTPEPALPSVSIAVDDGFGTVIATSTPLRSLIQGENSVGLEEEELADPGTYIVTFDPGTVIGLESVEFTEDPEDCHKMVNPNFCLTTPPMDYIVISTAGQTTVTAYLRQMPKWVLDMGYPGRISYTFSGGEVDTLSWKPYPPDE